MDVDAARAALGVEQRSSWAEVRAAYRSRIGAAHPDRAGGDTARAAVVNEAYAVLARARRAGTLHPPSPPPHESPPSPPAAGGDRPGAPPEVLDGHTIHLDGPPEVAFTRLVEACHEIGDVTYVDRTCAILEALVHVESDGVCSLVISLEARAGGTDAFCTLEAIEHVASPPVQPVVAALVDAL
jgi:hypothetical protein